MQKRNSSNVLLWLVAVGYFMQTLDTTIVNTALPSIAKSLGVSPLEMQAVVVSYTLVMAALILASGWLADRFGTRRVYLTSLLLFTIGSLCCAMSKDLMQLVASRILQGFGAAMLMPVGRLAVLRAFPHEKFLRAISYVTIPALVGPLIGPTLGGWLSQAFSWHWIFLINLPVGIAGFVLSYFFMDDFKPPRTSSFDFAGFLMIAIGMITISYALDGVVELGLRRAMAAIFIVAGAISLVSYWLYASRKRNPLIPPRLFKLNSFRVGISGNFFSRLGSNALPFMLPLFFQVGLGYSPLKSGLMLLPMALAAIGMKRIGIALINKVGYRRTLLWNTIAMGVAISCFSQLSASTSIWAMMPLLFVSGGINSLQFSAMNSITLKDLPDSQASSGNTLLSMVMMFSMSLGVALAAVLLSLFREVSSKFAEAGGELFPFHATFLCVGVISVITAFIFSQLPKDGPA